MTPYPANAAPAAVFSPQKAQGYLRRRGKSKAKREGAQEGDWTDARRGGESPGAWAMGQGTEGAPMSHPRWREEACVHSRARSPVEPSPGQASQVHAVAGLQPCPSGSPRLAQCSLLV